MKKIIFLSLLFFASCTRSYVSIYTDRNKYVKDIRLYFNNDSLKMSIDLGSDYLYGMKKNEFKFGNEINAKSFEKNKKIINKYIRNINVEKNNFIFRASTKNILPPYFHFYAYVFPSDSVKIDSDLFPVPVFDSESFTMLQLKKGETGNLYLLLNTMDKQEIKRLKNRAFDLLKGESNTIFSSFREGSNYTVSPRLNPFTIAQNAMGDSANYLSSINILEDKTINYAHTPEEFLHLQASLTYNSFLTNNPEYSRLCAEYYKKQNHNPLNNSVYDSLVLDSIKKLTQHQQVVMINEQHWQPKHRYLNNILLSHFYREGFRYLAVEAIHENEDSLNLRKYPIQTTGIYTKESQFANMLRHALQLGYKVVSYDFYESGNENREYMQAKNLYDKTIKKYPKTKVLVWAGIGHIDENQSKNPKMAYYFKEMSKIDPLTIEQTREDGNSSSIGNHFLAIHTDSSSRRFACDLFLCNNIREERYKINPDSEETPVKIMLTQEVKNKIKQHKKIEFMVFYKEEFDRYRFSAVPIINRLIDSDKNFDISLPDGKYYVVFRSPTSFTIEQSGINIKK